VNLAIPNKRYDMMLKKIKFGKIAVVIFLTILIWVWADLALDVPLAVSNVPITISKSTNSTLWVSFVDENESLVPIYTIKSIDLKGSASRISEVNRKLKTGLLQLDDFFFLDAEQEGMDKTGKYPLNVLNLLKRSDQIKKLGLTVQSCEPNELTVNVVELEKRQLDIECFNGSGTLLKVESIEPSSKVDMLVPAGSRLKAKVELTPSEIDQARNSGVIKIPYVVLAEDQRRQALTSVTIKMSPEADPLGEHLIKQARLGFTFSANLQGKYKLGDVNYNEVVSAFTIFATLEAKQAYEDQPYQMTLYILDDAREKGPEVEQQGKVIYLFPEEFVRRNEIRPNNPPKPAKFKLIPLTPETPPAAVN